jgi:hypothetical protein
VPLLGIARRLINKTDGGHDDADDTDAQTVMRLLDREQQGGIAEIIERVLQGARFRLHHDLRLMAHLARPGTRTEMDGVVTRRTRRRLPIK